MKKLQEKAVATRLGLYLHVPFCARACDFCHFYQEPPRRGEIEAYLSGMEKAFVRRPVDRPAQTAFWGGGTPGLLTPAALEQLGRAMIRLNKGQVPEEWTIEMAPSTVQEERLRVLRDLGVTRISMGVQSFKAPLLEALGRIHSLQQVRRAIDLLHSLDFSSFNLDLIFAIPGQSLEQWEEDLEEAVAAGSTHVSTYCLTYEEDTALWLRLQKGEVAKISEDDEAAYFEVAGRVLRKGGLQQYEVSNYARPGHECQHNIATWEMQEWLGYGPSAASQYHGHRWSEPPSLRQWLSGLESTVSPVPPGSELDRRTLAEDTLIFGLRMNQGVDLDTVRERLGGELPSAWTSFLEQLRAEGLLETSGTRITLSNRGRLLADRIAAELLQLG